jgi:hypothetical protein
LVVASCGTVDLGAPPADVNACRPSRAYFLSDVWPSFIDKDYSGKKCGDSRCHDPTSGRQFVVTPPKSAPGLPLPADWEANYISASMQMQCSDVKGSPLYTRAAGLQTHGPGKLIEPAGAEALVLQMWVTAP